MKRTLIVPESLESAAANLEGSFPEGAEIQAGPRRTDEFLEGAKWVLERDAETGSRVWQDPPIYALAMEGGAKQPRLTLFYTIAYDKVVLLALTAGTLVLAGNR